MCAIRNHKKVSTESLYILSLCAYTAVMTTRVASLYGHSRSNLS